MNLRISDLEFGKIVSVDGHDLTVKAENLSIDFEGSKYHLEIGAFVNCGSGHGDTICLISRVFIEEKELRDGTFKEIKIVELSIIGSLNRQGRFARGAERLPTISCPVYLLKGEQINELLGVLKDKDSKAFRYFQVGTRPMVGSGKVHLDLDKLLGRHVAILGTTGSGKSCTVARIVQSILRDYPHPRILFFDAHDEYSAAFSGEWEPKSNYINWDEFSLPYWFLDFEEFIGIFYPDAGGTQRMEIKDLIESLKKQQINDPTLKERISVDSPVFFEIDELIAEVDSIIASFSAVTKQEPWKKNKTEA